MGNSIGTIIVGLLVLAVVVALGYSMIKNKRAGKNSCGCGCDGCGMSSECHPTDLKDK